MKCIAMFTFLSTLLAASLDLVAEAPLIPPDAVVEVVSTGDYRFTEGPALAPDGSIYFSDIPNNSIHRYDPDTGETTLFTDDSGGANGLMFADFGLLACSGGAREVRLYPRHGSGPESPNTEDLADPNWFIRERPLEGFQITSYDGLRFNRPNDLAVTPSGGEFALSPAIYFTDPIYGKVEPIEMPSEAVFALIPDLDQPEGAMRIYQPRRIIDDLVRPNGIGLSPAADTLYVLDNGAKKTMAYDITEPGVVANGRLLNDLSDLGGPDGMTVDHAGRLYVAIFGKGILILSPDGDRLGFIETGPQTTNCVFGADRQTLYVTAQKSLKRVVLNTGAPAADD